MGTKYLSGKVGEPSEGGFVDLDTGVTGCSVTRQVGGGRYPAPDIQMNGRRARGSGRS